MDKKKSVINRDDEKTKRRKKKSSMYEISAVVGGHADVVTLIEGIFVAHSTGQKQHTKNHMV